MAGRKRSNSVKEALQQLEPTSPPGATTNKPVWTQPTGPLAWFVKPKKTGQLVAVIVAIWAAIERFAPTRQNPLTPFLFISYPLAKQPGDEGQRYGKGPWDLAFLAFYIVVFSFLRQSVTEFFIRPLARRLGLKTEGKITRFMEQAYAVVYFSASGAYGLVRAGRFSQTVPH